MKDLLLTIQEELLTHGIDAHYISSGLTIYKPNKTKRLVFNKEGKITIYTINETDDDLPNTTHTTHDLIDPNSIQEIINSLTHIGPQT